MDIILGILPSMYLYRSAKHAQTSRGKELLSSSGPADVEHSLALTFTPSC